MDIRQEKLESIRIRRYDAEGNITSDTQIDVPAAIAQAAEGESCSACGSYGTENGCEKCGRVYPMGAYHDDEPAEEQKAVLTRSVEGNAKGTVVRVLASEEESRFEPYVTIRLPYSRLRPVRVPADAIRMLGRGQRGMPLADALALIQDVMTDDSLAGAGVAALSATSDGFAVLIGTELVDRNEAFAESNPEAPIAEDWSIDGMTSTLIHSREEYDEWLSSIVYALAEAAERAAGWTV